MLLKCAIEMCFLFSLQEYKQKLIDYFFSITRVSQTSYSLLFSYLGPTHVFCERLWIQASPPQQDRIRKDRKNRLLAVLGSKAS